MGKETKGHDALGLKTGNVANESTELRNNEGLSNKTEQKHETGKIKHDSPETTDPVKTSFMGSRTVEAGGVAVVAKLNSLKTLDSLDVETLNESTPETTSLFPSGDSARASQPGAWGVHPTRRIDQDDNSTNGASSISGDEEAGAINDFTSTNNNGDASREEVLINAKLVDDEEKVTVDAQIWDEEMAIKNTRKRSIRWAIGIVMTVLAVVIALSVTITGRSDGGSANGSIQIQTVLASSSPTLSLVPSPLPSIQPSSHPSDVPSQSPTALIWQEQQVIDGVYIVPSAGTILRGGEQFGTTIHISSIVGSPLANRTGKDMLVVGSYARETSFISGDALFNMLATVAIFLCGSERGFTEDFCNLQTILLSFSEAVAVSLSGTILAVTMRDSSAEVYDLNDVDSYDLFNIPFPLMPGIPGTSNRPSVVVTDDADTLIMTTPQEQHTFSLGTVSPSGIFGVRSEDSTTLSDNLQEFYSMVLRGSTIITLVGIRDQPNPTSCIFPTCGIFTFDRFSIHREDLLNSSSVKPLVTKGGSSLFSHRGLAANGDASVVAVSSGSFIDIAANRLGFQVDVFQLVNETAWQPMGSRIFGPKEGDYFGTALVLNTEGNFLAVGAPADGTSGTDSGMVYSFSWDGEDWIPFGGPLNGPPSSLFGSSLDLSADGGLLLVGAPGADTNGQDSGEVTIFELSGV